MNKRLLILLSLLFLNFTNCSKENTVTQKQFANKLYDKQICSESNYKKLLSDINSNKLVNDFYFLKYCDNAIIIQLKDYPNVPENYLEKIHKVTASLIKDLSFTDFKFQIVQETSSSDTSYKSFNVIVSLKSHGKTYKQESFINPSDIGKYKGMEYFGKIDSQEYYKIFNKILSDIQSPYRLHEVKSYIQNSADYSQFGIIALTKAQAEMLHGGGVYFSPSYENFKNTLTSKKIDSAIVEYQKLGLFSHLNAEQILAAKSNVSQQENKSLNDVLQCFPNIIYFFDTELGNLDNPYEELLNELSSISKRDFNPINIMDSFSKPVKNKAILKFTVNGKVYSKELVIDDDWIDPAIFELIDKAVSENKLKGQFYDLYTGGQEASIVYLTTEQAEYLRSKKLLIFADQADMMEE